MQSLRWLLLVVSCKQVEHLKKKLPWLKYDQNKARFQASKDKEKETKCLLREVVTKSEDLKKLVE
jgi:hypothetical protein